MSWKRTESHLLGLGREAGQEVPGASQKGHAQVGLSWLGEQKSGPPVAERKDLGSAEHEPRFLSLWFYLRKEMVTGNNSIEGIVPTRDC